jgi:hypothetical protein
MPWLRGQRMTELLVWMTIDLDYPGIGLIRVSNLPLVETLAAMN